MDRVFLDANILFSAAYRRESGLRRLWKLANIELLTSAYAVDEARRNFVERNQRTRLTRLLRLVTLVPESEDRPLPRGVHLPDKDRPILLAALQTGATHLLTGDVTHFGPLYGRSVKGLTILLPAEYLAKKAAQSSPSPD